MRHILNGILVVLLLAGAAFANTTSPFTGHVGFGDSFSDRGRFGQLQPPSNNGRFTDGITWMETLGQAFDLRGQGNFNMALGGATAGATNTNDPSYVAAEALRNLIIGPRDPSDPDDIPFIDLGTFSKQVTAFANAGFDALVGDNPLVTILIGSNDFLQGVTNGAAVIGDIIAGIQQVRALGPQFNNFLLATLPDFSAFPVSAGLTAAQKDAVRNQSILFNQGLTDAANVLNLSGFHIEIFDLFSVQDQVLQEAQLAGLNVTQPCTDRLLDLAVDPLNCAFSPPGSSAFLFMDESHPGDFAHSRWAAAALDQVGGRLAPIPLPASGLLFVCAVGGLAVRGWRLRAAGAHLT